MAIPALGAGNEASKAAEEVPARAQVNAHVVEAIHHFFQLVCFVGRGGNDVC